MLADALSSLLPPPCSLPYCISLRRPSSLLVQWLKLHAIHEFANDVYWRSLQLVNEIQHVCHVKKNIGKKRIQHVCLTLACKGVLLGWGQSVTAAVTA